MRSRLLAEAEQLIRARGFSGFSYSDLAERVGIRKASVHHHFRSKLDLASAALAAYDARYSAAMSAILAQNTDALARVAAYADLFRQGVEQSLGCLFAVFTVELEHLPLALQVDLDRFVKRHVVWIADVLAEGQASGTVRRDLDCAGYARLIFTSLEGALIVERAAGGPASFAQLVSMLTGLIRSSAAVSPEP